MISPELFNKEKEARDCLKQLMHPKREETPEDLHEHEAAAKVRPELWDFPFENLVLEGGGNKGVAYAGLVKCLENVGILPKLKRFSGASAGAMAAAFIALGYSADEMEDLLSENLQPLFNDGHLPTVNLPRKFGFHPANKFYEWMSDKIAKKSATGNPQMAFNDLYRQRGVELCIVAANLNQMKQQLCHPKPTPDMPIRDAVRMSMSIPIYFQPKIYGTPGSSTQDYYVDGGVLNNYPITSFDGWGLSMEPKDSYLKRMTPVDQIPFILESQFDGFNTKTMGALLYAENERDLMRWRLERRVGANEPEFPKNETKLFVGKNDSLVALAKSLLEKKKKFEAVFKFFQSLGAAEDADISYIGMEQLTTALSEISEEQALLLFGRNHSPEAIMQHFDLSRDGKISFPELMVAFDMEGLHIWEYVYGYGKIDKIDDLWQFLNTIYNVTTLNLMSSHMKAGDERRTVGINTGHVGTMDFDLEPADKRFAFDRGYNATKSFLKYFVVQNPDLVHKKGSSAVAQEATNEQLTEAGDEEIAQGATN